MTWDQELPLCLSFSIHTWGLFCLTSGSRLTLQDLASFQPEVVDALEMPLGDYTLYSPPPPAAGAILSLVLNVLKGETPPRCPPPRPTQSPAPLASLSPAGALDSLPLPAQPLLRHQMEMGQDVMPYALELVSGAVHTVGLC